MDNTPNDIWRLLQEKVYLAPVVFYFELQFDSFYHIDDQSFTEVSGLSVEMQTEEIEEGGANCYKHHVPKEYKYSQLTCKRALIPFSNSSLTLWVDNILNGNSVSEIVPHDANLSLKSALGIPLASWSLQGLFPVKWSISDFNAMKNELVIETFVFSYKRLTRVL